MRERGLYMAWQKKKIDINEIDKEIERHKYLVSYYNLLKSYVLAPLEEKEKNNVEYVVYKKYIELGNVTHVSNWLNDNEYRHLGRKFTSEIVTNLVDLIVPSVSSELNFLAKTLKYETPFYTADLWWSNWEKKQFNQQIEHLKWRLKPFHFAIDEEIRNSIKLFQDNLRKAEAMYYNGDAQQKREARAFLNDSFNKYLKPYYDQEERETYILKI